jgi:hypothetical protein
LEEQVEEEEDELAKAAQCKGNGLDADARHHDGNNKRRTDAE